MKKRVEIEEADNGYTVRCYNCEEKEEDEKDEYGYQEPKLLVAKDADEAVAIAVKVLKGKGDK